jgi:hypothetical protein
MKRLPDWQLRMQAFVRERRNMPFAWGTNDCALFAADFVEAITGERVCHELRGHEDVRQAMRALSLIGGVRSLATLALGEPVAVSFASVGDVVVIQAGKREALSVCNGGAALAPGPDGVVAVSMQQALAAWRVG